MISLTQLDHHIQFPDVQCALSEPNGLLAFGGDLSIERLTQAYQNGIFPWFSAGEPILWWSPNPRGILPVAQFHCSRKLAKLVRQNKYQVTLNTAFNRVIDACAKVPRNGAGTWITADMIAAYKDLHLAGMAHSVEVWDQQHLVGGLYGVTAGKLFCGESMFHLSTDCSKLAMYYLVELLKDENSPIIDCQMQNSHLNSLGCIELPRSQFIDILAVLREQAFSSFCWTPRQLSF